MNSIVEKNLKSALYYASKGWAVLPLRERTKEPFKDIGAYHATTQQEIIESWWENWPTANVGLATGKTSGFFVLDIDPRNEGDKNLAAFLPLPETLTAKTGGGGEHRFFQYEENIHYPKQIAGGVELKANGGYVVADPSIHPNGEPYVWVDENMPIAKAPEHLLKAIVAASSKFIDKPELLGEGNRHTHLVRMAGSMRHWKFPDEAIKGALLQANHDMCKPPLEEKEVLQIVKSAAKMDAGNIMHMFTDLGNSYRFIDQHGEDLRYVKLWKAWLCWRGNRWGRDNDMTPENLAKITADMMYAEAQKFSESQFAEAARKHAVKSQAASKINAMLALAQSDRFVAKKPEDFDQDNYKLNLLNGTFNLKEMSFYEHRKEDHITKLAPVVFNPEAKPVLWLNFLDRIQAGNKEVIRFLQKAIGYSLTGDISEKCLFMLQGDEGNNGKTLFVEVINAMLGDYAQSTEFSTFLQSKNDRIRNDIAGLVGARFVSASEPTEKRNLDEALIKYVTGGDRLKVRFLHEEFFHYYPTYKVFLVSNPRIPIRGTDDAIWDRLRLVTFNVSIPEHERDRQLRTKLTQPESLSGILNWALEGYRLWKEEGLAAPAKITADTKQYREDMDNLAIFLEECCEIKEEYTESSGNLYEVYVNWCKKTLNEADSIQLFGKQLTKRGFSPKRGSGGERLRKGLRLKTFY